MTKKSKGKGGSHANMKPSAKTVQAVKELQQSVMMNELALAQAVKMLAELNPNAMDLGEAIQAGLQHGFDVKAISNQLEAKRLEAQGKTPAEILKVEGDED